jgi:uridine kinase
MKLYFIGGASGSGKTAVMPYLKELLKDDIAVYDFDDIGVPQGADKKLLKGKLCLVDFRLKNLKSLLLNINIILFFILISHLIK